MKFASDRSTFIAAPTIARLRGGLRGAPRRRSCGRERSVLTSDFGMDLGAATVRYPDVVVDAAGGAPNDLTATAPVLVAEVLSPSSVKEDLDIKPAEYLDRRA
jgi:Uma2 family endonuclease